MSSLGLLVPDRGGRIQGHPTTPAAASVRPRRTPKGSPAAALRTLPDRELVALAQERNADAFEVIFDRHATAAYSLARRMCGTRAMAEDVVQEAFLSLWRRPDRYDPARDEVRSWLLQIVHNGATGELRRGRVQDLRRPR